mmetsp:Transcript_110918/g.247706  ORF Transcript_110918/g.247706 Transcript_110918/m.247706 type:complete len:438 (+) Transcript_110918:667-1980(+)
MRVVRDQSENRALEAQRAPEVSRLTEDFGQAARLGLGGRREGHFLNLQPPLLQRLVGIDAAAFIHIKQLTDEVTRILWYRSLAQWIHAHCGQHLDSLLRCHGCIVEGPRVEGVLAGQRQVEHHADGPQVGLRAIRPVPSNDLRSTVERGSRHLVQPVFCSIAAVPDGGDAKVDDLCSRPDSIQLDEAIIALEITVNNSYGMAISHRRNHIVEEILSLLHRPALGIEKIAEGASGNQLCDQVDRRWLPEELIELHDVRMVERHQKLELCLHCFELLRPRPCALHHALHGARLPRGPALRRENSSEGAEGQWLLLVEFVGEAEGPRRVGAEQQCGQAQAALHKQVCVLHPEAHPALRRAFALAQLVVESPPLQHQLLDEGACGKTLFHRGRAQLLAGANQDAAGVAASDDLPDLVRRHLFCCGHCVAAGLVHGREVQTF